MIITCEECQARFRLADEKLKAGGTKVRCSKCRHVFTVMPPEPEPAEATVDFGAFNMEPVTEEEPAPAVPAPPLESAAPAVAPATAGGDLDLDFSGLAQSTGPGSGNSELAEEFFFADTATPAEAPPGAEIPPPASAGAFGELDLGGGEAPGELDFDATFVETDESPAAAPAAGPAEFAFNEELSTSLGVEVPADGAAFSFENTPEVPGSMKFQLEEEPAAPASGDFAFGVEPSTPVAKEFNFTTGPAAGPSEFGFETESKGESPVFVEELGGTNKTESFDFGTEDSFESSAFAEEPALGDEGAATWEQPGKSAGPSFDFDEPNFQTNTDEQPARSRDDTSMGFGEIDFAGEGGGATENFGAGPDFSRATLARSVETQPPPPSRLAPGRARSEAALPAPAMPRKSPLSRVMLLLVLLLLALCGGAGYFYFMGDGQKFVESLLLKVKGEESAAPVEQRIGLKIAGSSYVDNRSTGQLLVIQGSATNNFTGARSSITVKGLLLDVHGKSLQQQTVFCGNYLSEDRLRTMNYAQIEEAMNNQFGDSLANMNVKPGVELRFTIVFRNVPKEMANINVEVVDSKPGGL